MRRLPAVLPAVAALLLTLAAVALAAGPPAATTGSATAVGQTEATLGGQVDPNASATTWRVEYGTSDAYGLVTVERDAGSGDAPRDVAAPVTGLTAETTYHFRVVATNAAGVARGADRTFRTAAPVSAPRVSPGGARVGTDRATVTGRVDPRGAETTYRWEYGTTTRYGAATAEQRLPAGQGSRAVRADLAGLQPYTTYHVRLVATNAAGTARSADRTFRTLRAPSTVSATVDPAVSLWSAGVTVSGRISGQGIGGTTVALERLDHPFTGTWRQEATARADRSGAAYRLTSRPLWAATRLRVVTRTTVIARSPEVFVANRPLVGFKVARSAGGYVASGSIRPAVPQGRASVQRRTSAGRWVPVARTAVQPLGTDRSRFSIPVRRARRASAFRVVVVPNDGGAHARGISRERMLRGK